MDGKASPRKPSVAMESKSSEERSFDVAQIESMHLIAYARRIRETAPQTRLILDWHNIESEVMYRYAGTVGSLPKKLYARLTARRLENLESWILRTGFGHAVCSRREQDQLLALAPQARFSLIENGVDTERFAATDAEAHVRQSGEAGNRAAGLERLARSLGAVEDF